MREILYRAISLCRGEHWVYGQPRHYARNPHTEKWTIYDPATGIETDIAEETLGQYTGLTDKNGTKIFEGDIIEFTHVDYPDCEIIFDNGSFVCNEIGEDNIVCELRVRLVNEVIGNIHDNIKKIEEIALHAIEQVTNTPNDLEHARRWAEHNQWAFEIGKLAAAMALSIKEV